MKLITIEQVDNGYIVSNKPETRFSECAGIRYEDGGIHVFETFASMSDWLKEHFTTDLPATPPPHLGIDEV
jgi:hypothetical protein